MTVLDQLAQGSSTRPGQLAGTWRIDPVHSEVSFTVRHLMISKVRGRFGDFAGTIVIGDEPLDAQVEASVVLASIDTGNSTRDDHIRSADFFDVDHHPELTYRSTGIRPDGDDFVVDGELSLHGVTRPVALAVELTGFQEATPFGDSRLGFSATAEINRDDFGITFNTPLEGGGVGLGRKIQIALEIQAVRDAAK